MKKIFLFSAAASIFFAACNNDKGLDTKKDVVVIDTTGMYKNNASTDIAKGEEVVAPSKPEVKTITKVIYVDRTPRAVRHQNVRQATPVQTQPVNTVPDVNTTATQTKAGETGAGTSTGTGNNGKGDGSTASTTVPEKKKGWSNAAKDAAIGGASGAVLGAIIGKGKGAVIGGILGGAGGYILGRKKDKKDQVPQYVNQ
jgi:hypothetical protein